MKNLLYILTFVITATAIAQSSDNLNFEKQKLKQALTFGDKIVAASSMYSIINIEGPQSTYKDSLAFLYYNSRNFVSCFLVTNDILKSKPNNVGLLEMNAVSLESMGALKKASETYSSLLDLTKNNFHAYKLAGLHLRMNEYEKANNIIKQADALPDNGKMKVTYQVNKNYNQNVDLKAAIAYLEGIIALNLKKPAEAKISFQRAISIFPEFSFAKGELTKLQQ